MRLRFKLASIAVLACCGYGLWLGFLRDLPLFAVQSVSITGLHGDTAPQIAGALETTAREMTTTDVSVAQLQAAVSGYTVVASLHVHSEFPHGLAIVVTERAPVARLDLGAAIVPVAADGTELDGLVASRRLPLFHAVLAPIGGRVRDAETLAELRIVGDAPLPLRSHIVSVIRGSDGYTVLLHDGPVLYFGDATLPHAKWDAAAAVLASPTSRGARYIDVALPSRPAAQVGDPSTSRGATGASGSVASIASLVSAGG